MNDPRFVFDEIARAYARENQARGSNEIIPKRGRLMSVSITITIIQQVRNF